MTAAVARSVVAVLGPTATGKSRLALELARRHDGEIVGCDSTAVYRQFDIGTDKVPLDEQLGIPHHLVDIVEPTQLYTAADYARDAAHVIRDISARGRLPILVGGTGFYYRALVRGLFPGPSRDEVVRNRLTRLAERHGVERLHRALRTRDPESATRIQPRDRMRIVRALEVYFLTGRSLSAHFAGTRSPLADYTFVALGIRLPAEDIASRVAARVESQFARGVVAEVRNILAAGVPESAHPFHGLVYRQVLELLHGVRDEAATHRLIAQENRRYARRQLIWFRKEPNLRWLTTAGEREETVRAAEDALRSLGVIR